MRAVHHLTLLALALKQAATQQVQRSTIRVSILVVKILPPPHSEKPSDAKLDNAILLKAYYQIFMKDVGGLLLDPRRLTCVI